VTHDLVPLGDVASIIRGVTFKPDDVVSLDMERAVACMRTKNVQHELDISDVWGISEDLVKRDDQYLVDGDVLVSSANSWNLVGKCCAVPTLPWRSTFGGFVSVLRPDRRKIDPRYLFRWFASDRIQTTVRSFGQQTTNISNLNIDRCLRLLLPLPPITEQRRIAEIMDEADALRDRRRAALAQLDDLTRSIFLEMFGDPASNSKHWQSVTLGQVAEVITGFPFPSVRYVSMARGIRLCRGANVLPGRVNWSDLACWPADDVSKYDVFRLDAGDIVLAMDRPWIAGGFKIARIRPSDIPALLVQRVARIRGNSGICNEFLFHLLRHPFFASHCRPTETTIPHISPIELKSFTFPCPPYDLQQIFAHKASLLEKISAGHESALSMLDTLFASLQHRAFRGEL